MHNSKIMNLNTSLNIWIDHIVTLYNKNKTDTNYRYKGGAINGFKTSLKTKLAAEFIEQQFNTSIDTTNMDDILISLVQRCEPADFNRTTTFFIRNAVQTKFLISKKLSEVNLNSLNTILEVADQAYNDLEIDDVEGEPENESQNIELNRNNVNSENDQRFVINDTIENDDNVFSQQFIALRSMLETTLQQFGDQIKNLKEQNSTGFENKSMAEMLGLLSFRLNKQLKFQHTVKLQQQYLDTKTIPNALAIDKFFRPMKFNTNLLTKMDTIYIETVENIIKAIIEDTNDSINKVESDIEKIKLSLERFKTKDEINKLVNELKEIETKKLKFRFDKALKRGKKNNRISLLNFYKDLIEDDPLVDNSFSETNSYKSINSNNFNKNSFNSYSKQQQNEPTSILKNQKQRSRSNSRIRFNNQTFQNNNKQNNQQQHPQNNNNYIINRKNSYNDKINIKNNNSNINSNNNNNTINKNNNNNNKNYSNNNNNHSNNNNNYSNNNNNYSNNNNNYSNNNNNYSNNNYNNNNNNYSNNNYNKNHTNYNRNQNFRPMNQNQRRQ